jgi:5'(3')-deoxyribonucleotidase
MTQLALDFDSTLAAVTDVAFDLLCGPDHEYGYEDIKDWTWGFREFGKEAFLSALWHTWTLRPIDVAPMEAGLRATVNRLQRDHDVHIVTAHPDHLGITKGKKEWLATQGIDYDNFRVVEPRSTKAKMDYDIYIDDKPGLPAKVEDHNPTADMFLIDHAYNRGLDANYVRVNEVSDAAELLQTAPGVGYGH